MDSYKFLCSSIILVKGNHLWTLFKLKVRIEYNTFDVLEINNITK